MQLLINLKNNAYFYLLVYQLLKLTINSKITFEVNNGFTNRK